MRIKKTVSGENIDGSRFSVIVNTYLFYKILIYTKFYGFNNDYWTEFIIWLVTLWTLCLDESVGEHQYEFELHGVT